MNKISFVAAAMFATVATAPAQAANWIGNSINGSLTSNQTPGITDQFDSPAIVGAGVEFTGVMGDVFNQTWNIALDISTSSFTVTFNGGSNISSSALLDIALSGFSSIGTLTSAYSCSPAGFPCSAFNGGPNVVFTYDNNSVNMRFDTIRGGETYTFTASSGVPEPATWAMMIIGFGLVGGAMRRRNVKVAFA